MAAQQPGQHLLVNPGFGTRPVTRSLDPPGALPRRGNLPSPSQAHAEALGQLDQAALAVVIGLQKLLPQIIRIGSRHRHVRGESPSLLYTIGRNALDGIAPENKGYCPGRKKMHNFRLQTGFD